MTFTSFVLWKLRLIYLVLQCWLFMVASHLLWVIWAIFIFFTATCLQLATCIKTNLFFYWHRIWSQWRHNDVIAAATFCSLEPKPNLYLHIYVNPGRGKNQAPEANNRVPNSSPSFFRTKPLFVYYAHVYCIYFGEGFLMDPRVKEDRGVRAGLKDRHENRARHARRTRACPLVPSSGLHCRPTERSQCTTLCSTHVESSGGARPTRTAAAAPTGWQTDTHTHTERSRRFLLHATTPWAWARRPRERTRRASSRGCAPKCNNTWYTRPQSVHRSCRERRRAIRQPAAREGEQTRVSLKKRDSQREKAVFDYLRGCLVRAERRARCVHRPWAEAFLAVCWTEVQQLQQDFRDCLHGRLWLYQPRLRLLDEHQHPGRNQPCKWVSWTRA